MALRFLAPRLPRSTDIGITNSAEFLRGSVGCRCSMQPIGVTSEMSSQPGAAVYGEPLNLVVWVKANAEAGAGSLYRPQHELIAVFRVGDGPPGKKVPARRRGRPRSDVWRYAAVDLNSASGLHGLPLHRCEKPVALIADAMKDTTGRGEIVLDPFCGLGNSIVAGQRTGRRVYALEREPRLVDVAVRRWQALSGAAAVHAATGRTFKEVVDEEGTAKTVVRPADAEPPSVATVPPRIAGCDKNPAQRGE